MILRENPPLRHSRRAHPRGRRGFALIVTLSLMTLLLILVLALTTLVRLSLGMAQDNLLNAQARQNALLAAYIAVGQLQKFAGPDQRVTTTADIGRLGDHNDASAGDIIGGANFPVVNGRGAALYGVPAPVSPTPIPFGAANGFVTGGTRYWTAVWGQGTNPLGLYTGQSQDFTLAVKSSPEPILLNWLVSGDEGTPLSGNFVQGVKPGNGVVQLPTVSPNFTSDTASITSKGTPNTLNWTPATNDIVIQPSIGSGSTNPQSAVVLVGPNSGATNVATKIVVKTGAGGPQAPFFSIFTPNNLVVVPEVNITEPAQASPGTVTTGRYAWHVEDEGVKAKYNLSDPYAGQVGASVSTTGLGGQIPRYRFGTMLRTGIERMVSMSTYNTSSANDVSSATTYNANAVAALSNLLDPSQMLLIDKNLQGAFTPSLPSETLRVHYHDITVYSYGVLADTLRGGLRYDLTSAFEPGAASTAVFNDAANGLNNKTIIPAGTSAALASFSTEPNVVSGGSNINGASPNAGLTLINQSDGSSIFHGPAAPDQTTGSAANPGLKWNVLQSYYSLASKNVSATPVIMQAGSSTQMAISPVILQARIRIGQYADGNFQQYAAIQPVFVLANPYNFPITDPGGGLDLGYRINTDTGWEWGCAFSARNSDRNAPHGSGVGMVLGYDNTQNMGTGKFPNIKFIANYNGNFFYSLSADSPETDIGPNNTPLPGYYALLKNPVSFSNFIFPGSGRRNDRFSSALDQVAFHIPHGIIFQPGEAKVFSLDGSTDVTSSVAVKSPPFVKSNSVKITSIVGASRSTNALIYINSNQIVPILLTNKQPVSNVDYWALRDTGIRSASDVVRLNPTFNNNVAAQNLVYTDPGTGVKKTVASLSDIPTYVTAATSTWPDPTWGYISTPYNSIACTLELRYDTSESTINAALNSRITGATNVVSAGSGTGVAAVGQNVLTTLSNIDLTGDGLPGHTPTNGKTASVTLDPAAPMNSQPVDGYRRQYLGSSSSPAGYMPCFITAFAVAIDLPGLVAPKGSAGIIFNQDTGAVSTLASGNFEPSAQGNWRVYSDYNLRAKNAGLPPFASLNTGTTSRQTSDMPFATTFLNFPPYGRIFNQGPGNDDVAGVSINDISWINTALSVTGGFQTGAPSTGVNYNADGSWGYSIGSTTAASGQYSPGAQFCVLYNIPQRGTANAGGTTVNPNVPGQLIPDVPNIMSIGQLQHADVTADDLYVSVNYQPGNAIGNSYASLYVSRNSAVQTHPAAPWAANPGVMVTPVVGSAAAVFLKAQGGNAYDISYLMNTALWDRFFFSTLSQTGATTTPANGRLKFAAGYAPNAAQMGLGATNTNVLDPATGQPMFRAYAPARFMMIDGAFNINSTSVEAWKAVLSSLRGVAYASTGSGIDINGSGSQVSYFPRSTTSQAMSTETNAGSPVNKPIVVGSPTAGKDPVSYAGFRQLTDNDIDILAAKIVQQIHYRGPFLSLAQFVNRRLPNIANQTPSIDPTSISGVIQTAIDISTSLLPTLNNIPDAIMGSGPSGFSKSVLSSSLLPPGAGSGGQIPTSVYPDGIKQFNIPPYPEGSADPFSSLVGMPGWLTQADILEALGPILSARSDTFVIRSYGEVLDPKVDQKNIAQNVADYPGYVLARAWCEMVVQRVPDYLATDAASLNDPSATSGYGAPNPSRNFAKNVLSPVNAAFGRRFRIVAVRWLNQNDI